ncbi:MAG: amidohydrolase [Lachnospiraceae bacterium]|nr:amidohydrolase [Lachnospiraceae bacterium]
MKKRILYHNGVVYTADPACPTVSAFIVEGGRFVYVGNDTEQEGFDTCVDLHGQCVIPGLVDSHCHILAGVESASADMRFINSDTPPNALGDVLLLLLKERPVVDGRPILAMGFDLTKGAFSSENLDRAFPDRPVMVVSNDGHAALLNAVSMQILGIDRDTKDPSESSYFVRNENGDPTGLVIEIPAMMQCKKLIESGGEQDVSKILQELFKACNMLGYTTVFEAMSLDSDDDRILKALHDMDQNGQLSLRIATSFGYHDENYLPITDAIDLMDTQRRKYTSAHVHPDTLKLIADGTVEEYSALLFEPYLDGEKGCGSEIVSLNDMNDAASKAAKMGFSVHIHAIGDRAVSRALDVLCSLGSIEGTKAIAHNQLYRPEDIRRITKAGDIFFQTTPHWMKDDAYTRARLGDTRYLAQFPVGQMVRGDVTVSFGSDSCLEEETANPFLGMFYACTRGNKEICGSECLPPDTERMTREEALLAYTINGARQLGLEAETGSITAGKSADFVVTDRDIINCSLEELKEAHAVSTYFCGRQIH